MRVQIKRFIKSMLPASMQMNISVRNAMRRGAHDPEIRLLSFLSGNGSFLDVGANMGSWTGVAARTFKHVHAFESNPDLARTIKRLAPANVTVHQLVLSNRTGRAVRGTCL